MAEGPGLEGTPVSLAPLRPVDPVLKAIKEDDEEALTAMIKAGKNLSEPNKEGWLPLHEAAYYGQLNCLKALHRAYPAVIDQRTLQEETALYLATCRGHVDCLQFLLQAGAEPDISNKSRETPLYKDSGLRQSSSVYDSRGPCSILPSLSPLLNADDSVSFDQFFLQMEP
ncbi:hypothetical protein E5288_WYG010452 [Bos mutus]|uniref:Uncharacterized protein n=1 Tax=Bos mutus TaxID=72004 RepID=A0A6B0RYD9_9CETA|nr:hypothetical protein [Bos mutus]